MKKIAIILAILFLCGCVKSIHTATIDQNVTAVNDYLSKGVDIDEPDRHGFTPLIYAAYYGHFPMTKYLCDKGADVNRKNDEGQTALLYAAYYNHINIAKVLLEHDADPHIVNNQGYNAYEYAKKFQFDEMLELLKAQGAKPLY